MTFPPTFESSVHWSQWIDYWAVDWDNEDNTFHNEWQTYRTRASKDITLSIGLSPAFRNRLLVYA